MYYLRFSRNVAIHPGAPFEATGAKFSWHDGTVENIHPCIEDAPVLDRPLALLRLIDSGAKCKCTDLLTIRNLGRNFVPHKPF